MSDVTVDTAPIVAEIGRARGEMAVAVEALGDRLSPPKLKARAKAALMAKLADLKDRINPVHMVQRKLAERRGVGTGTRGVLAARVADEKNDRLPAAR